jgi:hypothetical protein
MLSSVQIQFRERNVFIIGWLEKIAETIAALSGYHQIKLAVEVIHVERA